MVKRIPPSNSYQILSIPYFSLLVVSYMDTMNIASDKISAYNKISRTYGTDDKLLVHEVHIIDFIGRGENVTASDLIEITSKTKGAISQTLDKLAKLDLLLKTKHPSDQRKQILLLTAKGEIVFNHHRDKDFVAYSRFLERLKGVTDEEFNRANEIIKTIFKINYSG